MVNTIFDKHLKYTKKMFKLDYKCKNKTMCKIC